MGIGKTKKGYHSGNPSPEVWLMRLLDLKGLAADDATVCISTYIVPGRRRVCSSFLERGQLLLAIVTQGSRFGGIELLRASDVDRACACCDIEDRLVAGATD